MSRRAVTGGEGRRLGARYSITGAPLVVKVWCSPGWPAASTAHSAFASLRRENRHDALAPACDPRPRSPAATPGLARPGNTAAVRPGPGVRSQMNTVFWQVGNAGPNCLVRKATTSGPAPLRST
jgi:hypothetical protein